MEQHVGVDAGSGQRQAQRDEGQQAEHGHQARAALKLAGHRGQPAAASGDDAQREQRQVLGPLPQIGMRRLLAGHRKDQAHQHGAHGDARRQPREPPGARRPRDGASRGHRRTPRPVGAPGRIAQRVDQEHLDEPHRPGVQQRVCAHELRRVAAPLTGRSMHRVHQRGPHGQHPHQQGNAEAQHAIADEPARALARQRTGSHKPREQKKQAHGEHRRRHHHRAQHDIQGVRQRDLLHVLVRPGVFEIGVAHRAMPGDDHRHQQHLQPVQVRDPLDSRARHARARPETHRHLTRDATRPACNGLRRGHARRSRPTGPAPSTRAGVSYRAPPSTLELTDGRRCHRGDPIMRPGYDHARGTSAALSPECRSW